MRHAVVFALALVAPVAAWAGTLPGMGAADAGKAAEFGRSLCLIAPQDVDAFKRQLDVLAPGTTTSSAFVSGQASARATVNDLVARRQPTTELRDSTCPEVRAQIESITHPGQQALKD